MPIINASEMLNPPHVETIQSPSEPCFLMGCKPQESIAGVNAWLLQSSISTLASHHYFSETKQKAREKRTPRDAEPPDAPAELEPEEPPALPELPELPELEPPPDGKTRSGLRMPMAEVCLRTSFQLVDEPLLLPDMIVEGWLDELGCWTWMVVSEELEERIWRRWWVRC